jgi:hypothetical protein
MSYYEQLLAKQGIKLVNNPSYTKETKQIMRRERACSAFDENGLRICCICRTAKTKEHYSSNRSKPDGLDARCKPCKSKQVLMYKNR